MVSLFPFHFFILLILVHCEVTVLSSTDVSGTRNLGFGFWKCDGFCQIFGICDDLAKWSAPKLIKYAKKLAKKEEKTCSTWHKTHFLADS